MPEPRCGWCWAQDNEARMMPMTWAAWKQLGWDKVGLWAGPWLHERCIQPLHDVMKGMGKL